MAAAACFRLIHEPRPIETVHRFLAGQHAGRAVILDCAPDERQRCPAFVGFDLHNH
ncbi:hypothetical protein X727_13915 [Mesorhizobium sp. L103C119B0]|nr:hypothetical protein X727_13915 [Mesorhizobium sp. L103C119B0]